MGAIVAVAVGALAGTGASAGARAGARAGVRAGHVTRSAAGAASASVTVSPLAGTPDASPTTQISFLGGARTTVASVTVVGTRSGKHRGRLEAYSTGTGESFIPLRAFDPGENVSVRAIVDVQSGDAPRQVRVQTDFRVAVPVAFSQAAFPVNPGDPSAVQHYASAPTLTPSTVTVTASGPGQTPGDFFLAPYQGAGTPGAMIIEPNGTLVWFHPLPAGLASTDFREQRYRGANVLTWWQGHILGLGFGRGVDEIYSASYRPLAQVRAGNGYVADLHQFLLTAAGTAWIDAVEPVRFDTAGAGGVRSGVVSDSIVQEIDVRTGLVMWEWHALGHIPLRDSYAPAPHDAHPWYYAHVNSIDPSTPGRVLISARNTWAVYDVDLATGAIVWRLGGKRSSFRLAPGAAFHYQHDAAWQPGGLVSLFDNGGALEKQSRGLVLDPNTASATATVVRQFVNPDATLLTDSQGDLLRLPGGNWLMGYGGLPNFTEYDSSGRVVLDATLGPDVQSYRTYLAPWSATPTSIPTLAAQSAGAGLVNVECSWNGATDVSAWEVLAGPSAAALSVVATEPRQGFETTIEVATSEPLVAVAALGAAGQVLARSSAIAAG